MADQYVIDELRQRKRELDAQIKQAEALVHGDRAAYERLRSDNQRSGRYELALSRDIGAIPPVADWERRNSCRNDLRLYLETYATDRYPLAWSNSHLLLIESVQEAIIRKLLKLICFPRGSGKTSISRDAIEWGMLYGHIRFGMLFGADQGKAVQHIDAVKMDLFKNDLLLADFPEVCYPIYRAEDIALRAAHQTSKGQKTELTWAADHIVFPSVPEALERGNAGAILHVGGLTSSAARGPLINGRRPDFGFVDDPQTRKSAKSETQVLERKAIINGDIKGMAGPTTPISIVITATVIYQDDLAHTLLDRQENPEWDGTKISMIEKWPKNMDLWDKWDDIRRAELIGGAKDLLEAHAFYLENQAKMDEGAQVYWEDRITPGFHSALESAIALYYHDPVTFASEFQNEPLDMVADEAGMPSVKELVQKEGQFPRFMVPPSATHVTAYIDVQRTLLYYVVKAWSDEFTGYTCDFGAYPDQKRDHWMLANCRMTLFRAKPGAGYEAALYDGLMKLTGMLEHSNWTRPDGTVLPISRGLIDAQYGDSTDVVYQVCADKGKESVWMPSHGAGFKATMNPINTVPAKPGELRGPGWSIPPLDKKKRPVRHVYVDVNFWKTMVVERWKTPKPSPGYQEFYEGAKFRMYAEHLNSEYGIKVSTHKRTCFEWNLKPTVVDNHFWDCDVGCAYAASIAGVKLKATQAGHIGTNRRRRTINADTVKQIGR